jgi:hypothetical protein
MHSFLPAPLTRPHLRPPYSVTISGGLCSLNEYAPYDTLGAQLGLETFSPGRTSAD